MVTQTLDGRYVDREKLVRLLKDTFGAGTFSVKVRGCGLREHALTILY